MQKLLELPVPTYWQPFILGKYKHKVREYSVSNAVGRSTVPGIRRHRNSETWTDCSIFLCCTLVVQEDTSRRGLWLYSVPPPTFHDALTIHGIILVVLQDTTDSSSDTQSKLHHPSEAVPTPWCLSRSWTNSHSPFPRPSWDAFRLLAQCHWISFKITPAAPRSAYPAFAIFSINNTVCVMWSGHSHFTA